MLIVYQSGVEVLHMHFLTRSSEHLPGIGSSLPSRDAKAALGLKADTSCVI